MAHSLSVREEFRQGMRAPEFRVTCSCGFVEKAQTPAEAGNVCSQHLDPMEK